jgi:hypothetical protein
MSTHTCRLSVLLPLVVSLPGCHKWVEIPGPYEQSVPAMDMGEVRATLSNGAVVTLDDPEVVRDTLFANWESASRSGSAGRTTRVPLMDISKIEERQSDPLATVGLAAGVTVVTLGALAALVVTTFEYGPVITSSH